MASVVRRIRRNFAGRRGRLVFGTTSLLRGTWTREVGLPFLERRFELYGLTPDEYKFYLRRSNDLARWAAGKR